MNKKEAVNKNYICTYCNNKLSTNYCDNNVTITPSYSSAEFFKKKDYSEDTSRKRVLCPKCSKEMKEEDDPSRLSS